MKCLKEITVKGKVYLQLMKYHAVRRYGGLEVYLHELCV
jgi:hypothetical protein